MERTTQAPQRLTRHCEHSYLLVQHTSSLVDYLWLAAVEQHIASISSPKVFIKHIPKDPICMAIWTKRGLRADTMEEPVQAELQILY